MHGKFILLLIVCMNIMLIVVDTQTTGFGDLEQNSVVRILFDLDDSSNNQVPSLSDNLTVAVDSIATPSSSSVSGSTSGFGLFLDVMRLVLALIQLILPLPILSFLWALNLAFTIKLMITIPLIVLYIFSLAEFVRGGVF